jgi:hypothetical protein
VDNTSDLNKPVSIATQIELDTKEDYIPFSSSDTFLNGAKSFVRVNYSVIDNVPLVLNQFVSSTPNETDVLQYKNNAWKASSVLSLKPDLQLVKTDVGLSQVVNLDTSTTSNITDSTDKRFVNDAEKLILSHTSGVNTGDETSATIKFKLGSSSSTQAGYLLSSDFNTFSDKQDFITAGSSTQYYNGLKQMVELNYSAVNSIPSSIIQLGNLTPSHLDVFQYSSGAWISKSPSQYKLDLNLSKSDVGLTNVDNTSDINKPISTATQLALDDKLTNLTSTSSTGSSLINTKSGTSQNTKRLAVNTTTNNLTVVDNTDHILLDTNGDVLKVFKEGESTSEAHFYQRNLPTNGSRGAKLFISGRHLTNTSVLNPSVQSPSISLFNPVHSQKASYTIGNGSIDFQILRRTDVTDVLGDYTFALGGYNKVSGSHSGAIGWNNTVTGSNSLAITSGIGRLTLSGSYTSYFGHVGQVAASVTTGTGAAVSMSASSSFIIGGCGTGTPLWGTGGSYSGMGHTLIVSGGTYSGTGNVCLSPAPAAIISGTGNLILASAYSTPIDRGMRCIYQLSLRESLNNGSQGGNSICKLYQTGNFTYAQTGTWRYLTSSETGDQTSLSTSTYKMCLATSACNYFEIITKVRISNGSASGLNIYKTTGYTGSVTLISFSTTTVVEQSLAGVIEIRVIHESGYIRPQVKITFPVTDTIVGGIAASIESYTTIIELGLA